MKKIVMVLVLAAVVAAGSAFADHPSGWGIGPGFQFGDNWNSDYGDPSSRLSVFLKAPQLPVYWGISADIFDMTDDPSRFGLALTGDYFLFDQALVDDIGLGWFLGVGGYFSFHRMAWDDEVVLGTKIEGYSSNILDFGVRVPIGLSFIPIDWLEIFIDFAPSVGLMMYLPSKGDSDMDLGGGWQADIGLRFWL